MTKKILLSFAAIILVAIALPTSIASAHVLKTDGTMGVVLHINPDDNPISGQSTNYVLYFNDTTGKFSLPGCLCGISISENGAVIAKNSLDVSSQQESSNIFVFPRPDVYTLHVTGSPKESGTFQPFSLDYIVRVSGSNSSLHQDFPLSLWLAIGLDMGIILLFGIAMMYIEDSEQSKNGGKK
jgi:hypothetical protein